MICSSCQKEIAEDSEFCKYCGSQTRVVSFADFDSEESFHKHRRMPPFLIFVIFLGAIVGVASFYSFQSFETKKSNTKANIFLKQPDFTAEKNSSEMVEQIARTAKSNIDKFSDANADDIIEIIRKAEHNFFTSTDEMEKFMWYGFLLDYKYDDSDPRSELGTDLTQAIKYVYRFIDSIYDDATQENLRQIDKDLSRIE